LILNDTPEINQKNKTKNKTKQKPLCLSILCIKVQFFQLA